MTDYGPHHHVYDSNDRLILTFTAAVWYDTATPAQWCIRRLKELNRRLQDEVLTIETEGVRQVIENSSQFITWIDEIFCVDAHSSFSSVIRDEKTNATIVVICGQKNSGKTTYVCALVKALTKRGFKVGTLKHTHHRHDVEGKDTDRHQVAGAEKVVLVSAAGLAIYEPHSVEPSIRDLVETHFSDYDIVFSEGYRSSNLAKIVVGKDPNANQHNVIATVPLAIDGEVNSDIINELIAKIDAYFET